MWPHSRSWVSNIAALRGVERKHGRSILNGSIPPRWNEPLNNCTLNGVRLRLSSEPQATQQHPGNGVSAAPSWASQLHLWPLSSDQSDRKPLCTGVKSHLQSFRGGSNASTFSCEHNVRDELSEIWSGKSGESALHPHVSAGIKSQRPDFLLHPYPHHHWDNYCRRMEGPCAIPAIS